MSIKTLQRRLTQVGVIRLGEKRLAKSGKPYPAKLDSLRFTSPSRPLIDAVAALYGGEVKAWQSPTGPEWEVITTVREIPVMVPPQRIDPNLELWGNGFRSRMCDGVIEKIRKTACLCEAAARLRYQQQGWLWPEDGEFERTKDDCKPTTRMSLMLARVPSMGTFKLESHGWNAAAELPMLAESIETAPQPIPARLEIQFREKKILHPERAQAEQIESRNYVVPVLYFDFVTPAQVFGGQIGAAARQALDAQRQAAIGAGPAVPADGEVLTPREVGRLARFVKDIPQLQDLWKDAKRDGALTDDVKAVLEARATELAPAPTAQAAEPAQTPAAATASEPTPAVDAAVDDAVDAEVEPDKDATWMQILAAAGGKSWNADALEERIYTRFNKPSDEINGWEMETFLAEINGGVIA